MVGVRNLALILSNRMLRKEEHVEEPMATILHHESHVTLPSSGRQQCLPSDMLVDRQHSYTTLYRQGLMS